jgi:hypothetical protein
MPHRLVKRQDVGRCEQGPGCVMDHDNAVVWLADGPKACLNRKGAARPAFHTSPSGEMLQFMTCSLLPPIGDDHDNVIDTGGDKRLD